MLEIIDLEVHYADKTLLSSVCFHLNAGELIHIQGSNGAGKTTLLNVLAGIMLPSDGGVMFMGQSIHKNLINYQSQLCYIGHQTGVNQHLTPRTHCHFDLNIDPATSEQWIQNIGLSNYADVPCAQLSFGQRRLVGLLRLNHNFKHIWLLDEPFVGLDHVAVDKLVSKLNNHLQAGGRIVLTSHQAIPETLANYSKYVL